jgi:exopolysaccharide production protein ExoQ
VNVNAISRPSFAMNPSAISTVEVAPFAVSVGFYLSFRLFFPLLAVRVFGQDAQYGVIVSLALNYLLLCLAALGAVGTAPSALPSVLRLPSFRWVLLFLGFSGISLLWSVTASLPAAIAFWVAMVADTAIVILLLRRGPLDVVVNSLMRGYIWGSCAIAVVAWLMPTQSDLRLGDEQLLGPNQIGWSCAFAFFLAQYLMRRTSQSGLVREVARRRGEDPTA